MTYLISYDIVSDRKRTKAAKILEEYGARIQYSVFECELTQTGMRALKKRLEEYVDKKTDSLIIFPLCQDCHAKKEFIGKEYNLRKLSFIEIN
jgi:CRISPR-associated protein Cas2